MEIPVLKLVYVKKKTVQHLFTHQVDLRNFGDNCQIQQHWAQENKKETMKYIVLWYSQMSLTEASKPQNSD